MKTQKIMRRSVLLALVAICVAPGCASLKSKLTALPSMPDLPSLKTAFKSEKEEAAEDPASEFGTPEKMLVVWKDCVVEQPGQSPMRGFGARVFFNDASGQAIKAEGELVIYGFDDSVKDRKGSEADQRFIFKQADLQSHYGKSGLGHSYSFQIAWDKVGGPEKSVTLIPFFKTSDGKIVRAGQSIYTLKGKRTEELIGQRLAMKRKPDAGVSQADFVASENDGRDRVATVGFDSNVEMANENANSIRTTTISVPAGMRKRLQNTISVSKPSTTSTVARQQRSSSMNSKVEDSNARKRAVSPRVAAAKEQIDARRKAAMLQTGGQKSSNSSEPTSRGRAVFGKPGSF
jgi:hypothetical protein